MTAGFVSVFVKGMDKRFSVFGKGSAPLYP